MDVTRVVRVLIYVIYTLFSSCGLVGPGFVLFFSYLTLFNVVLDAGLLCLERDGAF
jgi:hypothetical protein